MLFGQKHSASGGEMMQILFEVGVAIVDRVVIGTGRK